MATIHISEIQRLLAARGESDAVPDGDGGLFLEIRFDRPGVSIGVVDPEFVDRVLTADCPFGTVTIQFDGEGQLRSLDLS
ncbi:hypothetical protein [Patulibacter defluvii]|uniref:hypothetical protein n=1 Tax=Patulibacter defluvii TaxID=3095358 RepID=UPI002A748A1F|nr:hypothetical protein [Patulibacter sp. DM4]